ncbi:MAG: glutaminase A [Gemmatimonadales bacterium]
MATNDVDSHFDRLISRFQSVASPLRQQLRELHARFQPVTDGSIARYIPELALADPDWFGISVVTLDGQICEVGDSAQPFTIQSVSKPFVYGLALDHHGVFDVLRRVGVEPTGDPFNRVAVDELSCRPHNPMVNAGAIATTDLVPGAGPTERLHVLLDAFRRYAGREVQIDGAVFTSERETGHRNRAIAHLLRNFGSLSPRIEETLDLYFQQCSVLVTSRDLATMAATLANSGVNPLTGEMAIAADNVRHVLSVMYSCGMYDSAGQWAFEVGLPAKSGVSGGVLVVVPGQGGIGVYSPLLDSSGNSIRGVSVCRELARGYDLHVLNGPHRATGLRDAARRAGS